MVNDSRNRLRLVASFCLRDDLDPGVVGGETAIPLCIAGHVPGLLGPSVIGAV